MSPATQLGGESTTTAGNTRSGSAAAIGPELVEEGFHFGSEHTKLRVKFGRHRTRRTLFLAALGSEIRKLRERRMRLDVRDMIEKIGGGYGLWYLWKGCNPSKLKALLGPRDGEAVAIKKVSDAKQILDVFARVDALSFGAFCRLDAPKFALPVPQHVRLDADQARYFTDAKKQLRRQTRHGVNAYSSVVVPLVAGANGAATPVVDAALWLPVRPAEG